MTSAKLDANRRNALKSTGPRTPEGKRRSSRNAITHGIHAKSHPVAHPCPGDPREFLRRMGPGFRGWLAQAPHLVALRLHLFLVQDALLANRHLDDKLLNAAQYLLHRLSTLERDYDRMIANQQNVPIALSFQSTAPSDRTHPPQLRTMAVGQTYQPTPSPIDLPIPSPPLGIPREPPQSQRLAQFRSPRRNDVIAGSGRGDKVPIRMTGGLVDSFSYAGRAA